jgi:hypothetical protein
MWIPWASSDSALLTKAKIAAAPVDTAIYGRPAHVKSPIARI